MTAPGPVTRFRLNTIAPGQTGATGQQGIQGPAGAAGTGTVPIAFASLTTLTPTGSRQIQFLDYRTTPGDNGGGYFAWNAASTAAPDGGTIVQVTGTPTGRWIRQWNGPMSVRWFGATGNGVTDDTVALKSAFAAFQASALISTGTELLIDAGTYQITDVLSITGIVGGRIRGAGIGQTVIRDNNVVLSTAGALGYITLINCQRTVISDLTISCGFHRGTLASGISAGATSFSYTNIGAGVPVVGQRACLTKANASVADLVVIQSVAGGAVTFSPPTLNAYLTGDLLIYGPLAGVTQYSDLTLVGAQASTNCHVERIAVTGAQCCLSGFAVACNGGGPVLMTASSTAGASTITVANAGLMFAGEQLQFWDNFISQSETLTIQSVNQSTNVVTFTTPTAHNHTATCFVASVSDTNNEELDVNNCFVQVSSSLASFYSEGQNALDHQIICSTGSSGWAYAYAAQGGSFEVYGGNYGPGGFLFVSGGMVQHPWLSIGGACEGGNPGLIYSDPAWNTQVGWYRFFGVDLKAGLSSNNGVEVTGDAVQVDMTSCYIVTPGIHVKDAGKYGFISTLPSRITITGGVITSLAANCALHYDGVAANEIGVAYGTFPPTTTLANNATSSYIGRVVPGAPTGTSYPTNFAYQPKSGAAVTATSGTVTLTPDQANSNIIEFNQVLTANLTINVPAFPWRQTISTRNLTWGGFVLIFASGSGTLSISSSSIHGEAFELIVSSPNNLTWVG